MSVERWPGRSGFVFTAGASPSAWVYRFTYPSPGYGMGAFHGSELFYVFQTGVPAFRKYDVHGEVIHG